jgi:SMC interacting uncharacterized protein involved in chromosome segregation
MKPEQEVKILRESIKTLQGQLQEAYIRIEELKNGNKQKTNT